MFTGAEVAIGATATLVFDSKGSQTDPVSAVIKNTGVTDVFLGGSDVTAAQGFTLSAGATTPELSDLGPDDDLYGIAAVAGTVRVLRKS